MEGRNKEELAGVSLLGNQNTKYKYDYDPSVLETFVNKHPENDYVVTFDAYEFTSLCPKTGQSEVNSYASQRLSSATYRRSRWWSPSHSNSTCSASAITETSMRTVSISS